VVTDRVLATLAAAVAEFGGSVDKLTGDGLMAVFGAPTPTRTTPSAPCGPRRACSRRCAGSCRRRAAAAAGWACASG
jgi:class 3 adenylate cyclase